MKNWLIFCSHLSLCCATGVLDRPLEEDLGQADCGVYSSLSSCTNFYVSNDILDLSMVNVAVDTIDALCLSQVRVRTTGGNVFDCFMPLSNEGYWIDNGRIDLRCQNFKF